MSCGRGRGMLCGREGVWRRMDTCIYMADSLCYPPDTIMTLSISYTPIQNKKLKNIMIYKEAFIEDDNDIMLMYP